MNSQIWGSDLQWFLRSGGLKFCCQGAILGRHVGFADTKMFSGSRRHAQWVCFRLIPRDTSRAILAAFTANIPANIHWIGNNFIHRFGKFVFLIFFLWTFEFLIIKGVIFMKKLHFYFFFGLRVINKFNQEIAHDFYAECEKVVNKNVEKCHLCKVQRKKLLDQVHIVSYLSKPLQSWISWGFLHVQEWESSWNTKL